MILAHHGAIQELATITGTMAVTAYTSWLGRNRLYLPGGQSGMHILGQGGGRSYLESSARFLLSDVSEHSWRWALGRERMCYRLECSLPHISSGRPSPRSFAFLFSPITNQPVNYKRPPHDSSQGSGPTPEFDPFRKNDSTQDSQVVPHLATD